MMPRFLSDFCTRSPKPLRLIWDWYLENKLLCFTITGVIVGVGLGIGLNGKISEQWALFLGFPGTMFLRGLELLIVPIIFASLIAGAATLNAKASGKMAIKAIGYFLCTSLVCALLGLSMVLIVRPGNPEMLETLRAGVSSTQKVDKIETLDTILDLIRNAFPENIVMATVQQIGTVYVPKEKFLRDNDTNDTGEVEMKRALKPRSGMNAMGLIVFCMCFGTVLGSLGDKGALMITFFEQLDKVVSKLVRMFMWCTPIGVASLVSSKLIATEELDMLATKLAWYMMTVLLVLICHQLVMLPLIYFVVVRKNPFRFAMNLAQAWLTAFALSSSVATLPVSFRCMAEKNKCDVRVLRFVLPVGATINMDGTAMFVMIASIFLAQMNQIPMSAGNCFTLVIMATMLSVGAAAIPSASLFLLTMLTSILKVPTEDIGLLFTVDWLLDRLRTTSNIVSDCYASAVIEKWSQGDLAEIEEVKEVDDLGQEEGKEMQEITNSSHQYEKLPDTKPDI